MQKLQELQYEVLVYPLYSVDLSPTDYHFFPSLGNYLYEKRYSNQNTVITSFDEFLEQKNTSFLQKGIFNLPTLWQRTIDVKGEYFQK